MKIQTLVLASALGAAATGQALAHAHLKSARPPVNGTVTTAPSELDLTFTEGLNLAFTGVTVTAADKGTVSLAKATLAAGGDTTLVVPLSTALAAGAYTVSWHALSTDGHKTNGHYTFTIAP